MRIALILALALATPALADPQDQAAEALFRAGFAATCPAAFDATGALKPPRQQRSQASGGVALRFWRFACVQDFPTVTGVLILARGRQPPQVVALPWPDLSVTFGRAEAPGRRLNDLKVTAWRALTVLPNPVVDDTGTRLITEGAVPGVPDALLHGSYRLDRQGFRLDRLDFYQSPATLTDAVPVFAGP
jgi:hypothetical protein